MAAPQAGQGDRGVATPGFYGDKRSVSVTPPPLFASKPPTTNTPPLGSSVAARAARAVLIEGPTAKELLAGSYSSLLLRKAWAPAPPTMSTLPSDLEIAVANQRAA